jgi:putative membrane-bound dehydrogenase-like protein
MRWLALIILAAASVVPLRADDAQAPAPIPASEAAAKFTLPEGFHATLFAGEPDIVQPMSFTFDDRGRMWVVENLSYPKWSTDGTGNDRITILEDTDNDGVHDKKTIFYDKGCNLSGIEYGFGGVWLTAIPNLIFIPDRNHDDVPDGPPEIILDGWSMTAKHNVVNSPTWGPDGWLYGLNGILSNSAIGQPGTPDDKRVRMNCGVWRYHPTRKIFEAYAHGTTNPWGIDWDEYGQMFITNCVIKHLFHVVPGGHYDRMFGQDVNPHAYHLMPSIADHFHWAGGHWTTSRGGQGLHSDAGGGHAHVGCMVYLGDNWPKEFRNNVFTLNLHGNRMNRDTLEFDGSTYVAKHAPDFLFANDPWFRGLVVKYGPDGGVYVSDWTDTGECHNYEVADTSNGRIYKIVYGKPPKLDAFDLAEKSDLDLAKLQWHENEWWVRHARRLLQEHFEERGLVDQEAAEELERFPHLAAPVYSLRSLWASHSMGARFGIRAALGSRFNNSDRKPVNDHYAAWVIQFTVDRFDEIKPESAKIAVETMAKSAEMEHSHRVLLALASAVQRLSQLGYNGEAFAIVQNLVKRQLLPDPYLPQMTWYAVESLVETHRQELLELFPQIASPLVRECFVRRLASMDGGIEQILYKIAKADSQDVQADAVRGMLLALGGAARLKTPDAWQAAAKKLHALKDPSAKRNVLALALVFGDASARDQLLQAAADPHVEAVERMHAIDLLVTDRTNGLPDLLVKLLDDTAVRPAAIRGLAAFHHPDTAAALLRRYLKLSPAEKEDAVQTLAARPDWGVALLIAVKRGHVPRQDVSSLVVRQLLTLKDDRLKSLVVDIWGEIKPASQRKKDLTEKLKLQLTDDVIAKANVKNGQALFAKTCGNCHKLYGKGGTIGPELTGSQRTNLDYLLDNVLDPSAIVPREYQVTVLELASGRVVQGIVVEETNFGLTVQTPNERVSIPKDQIESRNGSNVSMMPEGLFDRLSDAELRDLVAYLKTKGPPE